jgi:KDO2-lipid IV(A) lauroyltransferase
MPPTISASLYLHVRFLQNAIDFLLASTLQYVLRYRVDVVTKNLASVFAYKDDDALRTDVRKFYRYLAKVFRQFLATPSRNGLGNAVSLAHYPQLTEWIEKGQSAIILMGHVGNWEWVGAHIAMSYREYVCPIYKKIKNKHVNAFMYRRRNISAKHLVESSKIGDLLRLMKKQPVFALMIADQNPGSDQGIIWTPFLGRETAFVNGPESLSTRYKLPVVYAHVDSLADGTYAIRFIPIHDGNSTLPQGEITARFAQALGDNIRQDRIAWLWSHRRWKRNT